MAEVIRKLLTRALADVHVTVADNEGLVLSGASGITPETCVTRAKGKVLLPGDLADLLLDKIAEFYDPRAEPPAPVHAHCEHAPTSPASSELDVMDKIAGRPVGRAPDHPQAHRPRHRRRLQLPDAPDRPAHPVESR